MLWRYRYLGRSPSSEYSTNFLYAQLRPLLRRHTVPQTSRPEIDRLGMMTVQRYQASARAGPEPEPTDWSMSPLLAILRLPQQNDKCPPTSPRCPVTPSAVSPRP